jgi:four helix bundle protein
MLEKAVIGSFKQLIAWQEAHKLTLTIYKITEHFPKTEIYNLISQLRRAAVSIESCIAEGFHRYHYKDRLVFFYDARGSIGEVQSQLIDALDLKYISQTEYNELENQTEKTARVLGGLIRQTQSLSVKKVLIS